MGMYNLVFGQNPDSGTLLGILGFHKISDVGRFRDAWVEMHEGEPRIVIYTRNGGGNRECITRDGGGDCMEEGCYACTIGYRLPAHPLYWGDVDDDFDTTYARVFFHAPAEYRETLQSIAIAEERDPSKAWDEAIDKLDRGESPEVQKNLETALAPVLDHLKGDPPSA